MKAYVFPGQGSQHPGMGKELYEQNVQAKEMFEQANEILGFRITDIMFSGSDEDLRQTKVTQPAIFIHSVIMASTNTSNIDPQMVAGHSLGEFSSLVANRTLNFETALKLVSERALAMQEACEKNPSIMAAVLGMNDAKVEEICDAINGIVVPANYNSPGQLVISGTHQAIDEACAKLLEAGAKRAIKLNVGGAFHSPLMESARERLEIAIRNTNFSQPICPVYQNVDAKPHTNTDEIRDNLIAQLTAPVRWTQIIENMIQDGASSFTEVGPGNVLQGLIKKVSRSMEVSGLTSA
ncbi:MAG TPA: ACP S-malonyltransferase [Bacteroidia bacterium]|nr:ACP S-malonyltransferase [Bacteroidia bacterium]HNT80696.1 ACP S-malonyltransferase [Bacteroidia bacterium]